MVVVGLGGSFAVRTRERLREEILIAARAEVMARGWRGLRMQGVADAVGISRQTINHEFTNKQGLARALVLALATSYLDSQQAIVQRSADVHSALRDTVAYSLELLATDGLFRTMLGVGGSETYLPLYTTEGGPLISLCADRMTTAFVQRWPALDPVRVRIIMEMISRQVISHAVSPLNPPAQVAHDTASVFARCLHDPIP
ncbi:MAG: TetR/AcrR family transcriptional regulator [Pseudonocardia sp.]